jgi:transketolase
MDPLDRVLAGFDAELRTCDGHDLAALRATLAPRSNRPVVAILHTRKGNGVPAFEGRMESHYLPLTDAQYHAAMARLDAAA